MRTNYRFKTALLLLMAVGGASSAWADKTPVAIPQDLGNYITWDKADTNCTPQGDNAYVGNTNGDNKYAEFEITNTVAQDYIMTFATGSTTGNTGHLNVEFTNSESEKVIEAIATVEDTGGWTNFNTVNYYKIDNLPAGTYTLRISVKDRTNYCGNWSKLAFYSAAQCTLPLKSSAAYLELSTGVFNKANDNANNVVSYIRPNGYISNVLVYNGTEDNYLFNFNLDAHKGYSDGKVRITIYDALTGAQELQTTADASSDNDKSCALPTRLTTGWKTIRFDFLSETAAAADSESDKKYLFNFRQVNFNPISQTMPLMSGTPSSYVDLTSGIYGGNGTPRPENDGANVGYVYNGGYAEYYMINENETAYYNLCVGIHRYQASSQLKVTITDIATGTDEDTETFDVPNVSSYANCTFKLSNALTAGVKKVRFDFINTSSDSYIFNYKNINFYKRSLNEAYDYTPVEASGVDVVLTRSISKDNWSTICLPFAMTSEQITSAFGSDAKVAALTSATADALTFSTVTAMEANQPYAIKVATDFTSATISSVDIVDGTPTQTVSPWNFVGSYAEAYIPQGSYYFSANKLWQANNGTGIHMKPFRAYFTNGTAAPTLNFIIDSETTGIGEKLNVNSNNAVSATYYNLNGQRVSQPTKGLYIVNGKKVIIK